MKIASVEPGKFYGWISLAVIVGMYFILIGFSLHTFQVFLPLCMICFGAGGNVVLLFFCSFGLAAGKMILTVGFNAL